MRLAIALGVLAACIASGAFAGAVEDGNAGLDALGRGDYRKAANLFTRAIESGELAPADKELAYLNRGQAYMGLHRYKTAARDFQLALSIRPQDGDAQAALARAQAAQRSGTATVASRGWGYLATLPGRYFWMDTVGQTPHRYMVRYDWIVPQQELRYIIRTKSEKYAVGIYKLDPASGVLMEAQGMKKLVLYGTVTVSPTGTSEYAYLNGTPIRSINSFSADGSQVDRAQKFVNGAWQDISVTQYTEVSEAEAASKGFFKAKKRK